ncbi:MAG: DUF6279 family lipoprotein [Orrella sp.]|jgi:hypothetical protein|uniref:DUF6279 family lipoprotein n=2 Tax=Orrella sp. TaxID=1921583 RepID=UPI003BD2D9DF
MRFWRHFVLILGAVSIGACSSIQFGYNNAPSLLQYQMDSYLDLTDQQEEILSQELKTLQSWHRQAALPDYAAMLRLWAEDLSVKRTFTVDDILQKQNLLQAALLVLGQESAVRLAPLVLTLSPEQKDRLRERFGDGNSDYARENQRSPKKMAADRRERFIKQYERWLGDLTREQLKTLDQWLLRQPNNSELWGQERIARQEALLSLLAQAKESGSAQQAALALHDYFQSLSRYRIAELQSQRESRQTALATLTADLLNQMTPSQRSELKSKLLSYAQDFETLSR